MKKMLSILLAIALILPAFASGFAAQKELIPAVEATKDTATITVTVGDVWGDGSGYQMLLDADANAMENGIIPVTGPLTTSGDATPEVYAEFEYKMPENADGSLSTTNFLINTTATLEVPAGVYDFCFTNPTVGDRMWIANSEGGSLGRADNFAFAANTTYAFTISLPEGAQNDFVALEELGEAGPAVAVNLNYEAATLELGSTLALVATMQASNTTSVITGWESDNPSVATVDNNGLVTAVALGQATITVSTDNGLTASCIITVASIAEALNGEGMDFNYQNDAIYPWVPNGDIFADRLVAATTIGGLNSSTTTLSLTLDLEVGQLFTFDWFVSSEGSSYVFTEDASVTSGFYDYVTFKINDNFAFKAKGNSADAPAMNTYIFTPTEAGTYTFSWTYQKDSSVNGGLDAFFLDNCLITTAGEPESVVVTPTSAEILDSQTIQLAASVLPPTAIDLSVTWSSSDTSIATVDENGLVLGVAPGTATITATSNYNSELFASCELTVNSSAESNQELRDAINVEGGTLPFINDVNNPWLIDETTYPGRTTAMSNIAGMNSTYTSISLNIEAQAGKLLMFDYFVSSESTYDSLQLYVNDIIVQRFSGTSMTDFARAAYQFPEDGTYSIMWTYIKDSSMAGGLDTAWIDEVEIADPPALTDIEVAPASVLMGIGGTKTIAVSPIPSLATLSEITWNTDNEAVATVADGVITAVALGSATITATSAEGYTATVAVEVVEEMYANGYVVAGGASTGLFEFGLIGNTSSSLGTFTYSPYALEYINGTLYGYAMDASNVPYYIIADAETLEATYTQVTTMVFDMAYDHSTGILYGLVTNGETRALAKINPFTGDAVMIADITGPANAIITLACTTEGTLYGIELSAGNLYTIDHTTAAATLVGPTGVSPNYVQSMAYDHNNDTLLWGAYSTSTINGVYTVDMDTGAAAPLYPGIGEICGLYVEYQGTPLPSQVAVTGVTLEPTTLDLEFRETAQLTATIAPEDASDTRLTWTSSDPLVARVNSTGFVTGAGEGTATITVTTMDGNYTASCVVTCTAPEIGQYVYTRTDEILPGEVYVIGAVDDNGAFFVMTDDFGLESGVQIKASPDAVLSSYEGEEAVIAGINATEEWLFEAVDTGVTIRNENSQRYANPALFNGYYWLSLTETSDMFWIWDSANNYFTASNAASLGQWSHLAYGNTLNDPSAANAFDIFADDQEHFVLQLYVRQEVGAVERPLGDANNDGVMNTGDAAFLLRCFVNLDILPVEDEQYCDVNDDGVVNTGDAALILELCLEA